MKIKKSPFHHTSAIYFWALATLSMAVKSREATHDFHGSTTEALTTTEAWNPWVFVAGNHPQMAELNSGRAGHGQREDEWPNLIQVSEI